MNIQISDLTVGDPLAGQEVAIVIRVLPDSTQRLARTALVSVGTAGQPPAFASGTLEEVAGLIWQAWLAFGVQAEVRQRAPERVDAEAEMVAEAVVVDEVLPNPAVQSQSTKAPPRPQNLSLF
ncbi:MAG: hypothetical protein GX579_16245 [Chloroflexi bacterium]|nr:hypothetical protein [Chloroflexota bacterium]